MQTKYLAHIAVLLANVIYALNFSIGKDVTPAFIAPYAFVIFRVAGAAALFWLIGLFFKNEKIDQKDYLRFFFCSFIGHAFGIMAYIKGLGIAAPINGAIIYIVGPIAVALLGSILYKDIISVRKGSGVVLGAAGALGLILFNAAIPEKHGSLAGDLYMLTGTLSYAVYLLYVTPLMKKYHPFTVLKWCFTLGTVFALPVGWQELTELDFSIFTGTAWFSFFYVIVAATFLTYLLNNWGVKQLGAGITSFYIFAQPLIATIFAQITGKDEITWIKLSAGLLICSGLYLVTTSTKKI